jgi:hypothetical protein
MAVTMLSGTDPPADSHSPQKKETLKKAQQAPQVKQGLLSDMIGKTK